MNQKKHSTRLRLFWFIPHPSSFIPLLVDSFEFDVFVEAGDGQTFAHFEAAGESGLIICSRGGGLFVSIPELAVGAVAVPAEVAVGDAAHREKLEAAQQAVVLRHFDAPTENLNLNQTLVWLKQIAINQACSTLPFPNGLRQNFAREYNKAVTSDKWQEQ
jgi:hypothetical protein